jgi:hypothetical protein
MVPAADIQRKRGEPANAGAQTHLVEITGKTRRGRDAVADVKRLITRLQRTTTLFKSRADRL